MLNVFIFVWYFLACRLAVHPKEKAVYYLVYCYHCMQRNHTILFKLIFVYAFVTYISMWHFSYVVSNKKYHDRNHWRTAINSMPIINRLEKYEETHSIDQNETLKIHQRASLPIEFSDFYTKTFSDLSHYNTTNYFDKKMINEKFIADNVHTNILPDLHHDVSDSQIIAKQSCFAKIAVWYLPTYLSQMSLQTSFLSDHLYFLMHFVKYWQARDKKVVLLIVAEEENLPGAHEHKWKLFESSQLNFDLDRALRACYDQKLCIHVKCDFYKHDKLGHTVNKKQQNSHDISDTHILQMVRKMSAGLATLKTTELNNEICGHSDVLLNSFESFAHCQPILQALVLKEKATSFAISVNFDTFEKALHAPSGFTCLEEHYVLQHRQCLLFMFKVS